MYQLINFRFKYDRMNFKILIKLNLTSNTRTSIAKTIPTNISTKAPRVSLTVAGSGTDISLSLMEEHTSRG